MKTDRSMTAVEKRARAWARVLTKRGFDEEVALKYARRRFGAASC
jgi:hypothetical protein